MATGLRIVIVEEQCLSRNVLVKALHAWGYSCAVVEDEDAAWAAVLGAVGPTLILADWHADFLECSEFIEKVRARPAMNGVHILCSIPRGAVGAIRSCINAGADDYVFRPYDLDEMRVRLHIASKVMGLAPVGPVFPAE